MRARSLHCPKRHYAKRSASGRASAISGISGVREKAFEHGVRFGKPVGRLVELAKGKRSF
jgi:hypothetical protein